MNAIKTYAVVDTTKLRICAMLLAGLFASAADADCGPVIAAYAKAEATKRYAIHEVDGIAKAPAGEPFTVTIGEATYSENIVRKGPLQFEKAGYKKGGSTAGFEADSLKGREKKGEVRCEPLGERKIGAEQAIGYQIRSNAKGNQPDPYAIHMWVNRATGLPLFHGMGSDDGGFRWVYGSTVSAPPTDKIVK